MLHPKNYLMALPDDPTICFWFLFFGIPTILGVKKPLRSKTVPESKRCYIPLSWHAAFHNSDENQTRVSRPRECGGRGDNYRRHLFPAGGVPRQLRKPLFCIFAINLICFFSSCQIFVVRGHAYGCEPAGVGLKFEHIQIFDCEYFTFKKMGEKTSVPTNLINM